jgi:two-component system, NarL family, response regulator DegU
MKDIKVLLADDHPIVCKGIHDLLEAAEGIKVVGEANSGQKAIQMVKSLKPDIVLLDIEMPDINGVEVLNQIVESSIPVKVLVLSSYDDREYISQVIAMGAAGYLIKDEVTDTIVEAVRGVARGEKGWVSRRVAERLSLMLDNKSDNKDLTPRELDVLGHVSQGKTNAEIGLALGISEKTVEKHLDMIFRKMGVVSRVEAAVMAVREHIV